MYETMHAAWSCFAYNSILILYLETFQTNLLKVTGNAWKLSASSVGYQVQSF